MTKYLETAKIKKHSATIGLHPYLGNRSIYMIGSRGSLRPRGSQSSRPRGTTPQPRQRLQIYIPDNNVIKVEEIDQLTGLQHFVEEAARRDDIIIEHYDKNDDIKSDFNKLLQYLKQFLRLLLSVGRLSDDWRRRPIQGTLHF
eukprot:5044909-Amphidinium_carterae.1